MRQPGGWRFCAIRTPVNTKKFKLLVNEPPLQLLPSLAAVVGLNEAIFLQQLHYWTQNDNVAGHVDNGGRKWLRNTLQEWHDTNFPFWHISTINRVIRNLEEQGLVELTRKYNTRHTDRGQWVRLRYGALAGHLADCEMDFAECNELFAYCKMFNNTETTRESIPGAAISQIAKWGDETAPQPPAQPGADQPEQDEFPLIYAQDKARQAQWEDTVRALFEVCNLVRSVGNVRHVNDLAVTLVEGSYEPGWLRTGFVDWWYAHDWRGKRRQAPTLKAIEETVAEARVYPNGRQGKDKPAEPAGWAAIRAAMED